MLHSGLAIWARWKATRQQPLDVVNTLPAAALATILGNDRCHFDYTITIAP
jgi:hypothetical protein